MEAGSCLYIVTDPFRLENHVYKVGHHTGNVKDLTKRYRTELARVLILGWFSNSLERCCQYEETIKKFLKGVRIKLNSGKRSEWYLIDIKDLHDLIKDIMNDNKLVSPKVPKCPNFSLVKSLIDNNYKIPSTHSEYLINNDDYSIKKNCKKLNGKSNSKLRYCPVILKSGERKGQPCDALIQNLGDDWCGRHKK
jgi:hypothetical protein